MRLERLTTYLVKHHWLALVLTFGVTLLGTHVNQFAGNMPVGLLFTGFFIGLLLCTISIGFAALMTLEQGAIWGFVFTLAATLPYLSIFFINKSQDNTNVAMFMGLGVAVAGNLFTWVFAMMLFKNMTWRQIIQTGALLTALVISIVHLVKPDISDWWGQQLQLLQSAIVKVNPKANSLPANDVDISKQFINGMIAAFILISAVTQLCLARWWQFKVFSPGKSLRREIYGIRLSSLAGILFICSLLFSYLGNSVVVDIMPVLYVLFGLAGLSLVHCLFRQLGSTKSWFWLAVLYLLFFFAQPISIILVAMFALLDTWLDVRKRCKV